VHKLAQSGVSQCGIEKEFMPRCGWELAGNQGDSFAITEFGEFHNLMAFIEIAHKRRRPRGVEQAEQRLPGASSQGNRSQSGVGGCQAEAEEPVPDP